MKQNSKTAKAVLESERNADWYCFDMNICKGIHEAFSGGCLFPLNSKGTLKSAMVFPLCGHLFYFSPESALTPMVSISRFMSVVLRFIPPSDTGSRMMRFP